MRALLLLSAVLLFSGCGAIHTALAERHFPPQGRFLPVGTGYAHYIRAGSGSPVVYIHGSLGSTRDLTDSPTFPLLTARYDVIAFDRPGFGYTRRPCRTAMSIEDHARALHGDLAALHLTEKPLLVGHSMGGAVALAYAELYPDEIRGAVLLGGLAYPQGPPSALERLSAAPVLGDLFLQTIAQPLGALLGPGQFKRVFGPMPAPRGYERAVLALGLRPAEFRADSQDALLVNRSLERMIPRYPAIKVPLEILQGELDKNVSPEDNAVRLHAVVPNSTLVMLPGVAHAVQFAAPQQVLHAVERLLRH